MCKVFPGYECRVNFLHCYFTAIVSSPVIKYMDMFYSSPPAMLPTMCIERCDALPRALGAHADARGGKVRVRSRCEEPAQLTTVGADLQLCRVVGVHVQVRMVSAVRNQGVVTYVIATYLQNGRKNVARSYAFT